MALENKKGKKISKKKKKNIPSFISSQSKMMKAYRRFSPKFVQDYFHRCYLTIKPMPDDPESTYPVAKPFSAGLVVEAFLQAGSQYRDSWRSFSQAEKKTESKSSEEGLNLEITEEQASSAKIFAINLVGILKDSLRETVSGYYEGRDSEEKVLVENEAKEERIQIRLKKRANERRPVVESGPSDLS